MTDQCTWIGASGSQYVFNVYLPNAPWSDVPGNYIFAKLTSEGWLPLYTGETESFQDRFANHHKWECARKRGATHIHARTNRGGQETRRAVESDLIEAYDPPCNEQG